MTKSQPLAEPTPDAALVHSRSAYAVWEITLRCNLACKHCGSRAGSARPDELSTDEALDVVSQLAQLGISEVTLIGGEAFLRPDWRTIAAAIVDAGMTCTLTTGGYGIGASTAHRMKAAGISLVSISVDGLESTHDFLRGRRGSWRQCFCAFARLRAAGVPIACNTQINRLSAPELPRLYERLRDAGILGWQVQLTAPMGHAADNADFLLQPPELLDVFPMLARVARRAWRERVQFSPANNVGYYGPYERLLRANGHPWGFWQGPVEGLRVIGIESDGSVKADPTLPSEAYRGGNVRDRPLREIMESAPLTFNLGAGTPIGTSHLWGFCKGCEFAELCRGGDTFTAHVFFGRRGNNPYCHHRALVHQIRGIRERLIRVERGRGDPYDHGTFSIVREPAAAPWPSGDALRFHASAIDWPDSWDDDGLSTAASPRLDPGGPLPRPSRVREGSLLPRSAWPQAATRLRALLRAKRSLDRIEAERR